MESQRYYVQTNKGVKWFNTQQEAKAFMSEIINREPIISTNALGS